MAYQQIPGIKTKKIERGDCQARWELIKPELPNRGVVIDIGCAEGYFLKQIADETNLLAIGLEKVQARVDFQNKWLTADYQGKVISCQYNLTPDFTKIVASSCEWVDCILALSVLHWINNDAIIRNLASITGKLIVEIPKLEDKNATGQNFMKRVRTHGSEKKYFEAITGKKVRFLGETKAHTSKTRNLWIIEGDVTRKPIIPHINYNGKKAHYKLEYKDNEFSFYKHGEKLEWINGINLATLEKMNVNFPNHEWWFEKTKESIEKLDPTKIKGDLRIHNLIISRDSFDWIDLNHHGHKSTIISDINELGAR